MTKLKFTTGFILLLAFGYAKGQDKIITIQKDTILCKIISISSTHIQYEQTRNDESNKGRFIPIDQVLEYDRKSKQQEAFQTSLNNSKQPVEPFDRWRFGVQGGGAYLLSSFTGAKQNLNALGLSQSEMDNYFKKLRNGIYGGADIHYLLSPSFGLGVSYSFFTTLIRMNYNSINLFSYSDYYDPNAIPTYFSMGEKDRIYVNYIGPSAVFQQWLDKNRKFRLNGELSIGYALYREEEQFDPYQYLYGMTYPMLNNEAYNTLLEGNTWGGSIRISLEYYPVSWLSVGINTGGFTATLKSLNLSTSSSSSQQQLDNASYIDMSRLDYSIGIRFHF